MTYDPENCAVVLNLRLAHPGSDAVRQAEALILGVHRLLEAEQAKTASTASPKESRLAALLEVSASLRSARSQADERMGVPELSGQDPAIFTLTEGLELAVTAVDRLRHVSPPLDPEQPWQGPAGFNAHMVLLRTRFRQMRRAHNAAEAAAREAEVIRLPPPAP